MPSFGLGLESRRRNENGDLTVLEEEVTGDTGDESSIEKKPWNFYRILAIFVSIVILALLICNITFIVLWQQEKTTKTVLNFAEDSIEMLEMSLNKSVNPCVDFYRYTCDKMNNLPEQWMSMETKIANKLDNFLKNLLDPIKNIEIEDQEPTLPTKSLQDAHLLYRQCLSETKVEIGCFTYAKLLFQYPLAHAVMDHFELWDRTKDMAQRLNQSLVDIIHDYHAKLTPEEMKNLTNRLDEMNFNIGLPSDFANKSLVEELYADNNLQGLTFREMVIEILDTNNITEKFNQSQGRLPRHWPDMDSFSINAECVYADDMIVLPASELLHAEEGWSDAMNYGALGAIIGHEISHNFGKEVIKYWSPNTPDGLQDKYVCLEHQYIFYSSVDENFADNSGLFMAYRALGDKIGHEQMKKRAAATDGSNSQLTNEQVFFISYAHSWCHKYSSSQAINGIGLTHSLNPVRVLIPMQNSIEFANAFKCPLESPMNPTEKCLPWRPSDPFSLFGYSTVSDLP